MRNITKDIFLSTITCPTLGWQLRNSSNQQEPTLGERFRIEQGIEVGKRARSLYPEGLLIDDKDIVSAAAKTRHAMEDQRISILFEAAFVTDGYATRSDVLKRNGNRWHLVEVKSSVNDHEEFIDDLAYTALVLTRCGVDIANASLLLISRDYRLGMNDQCLFVEIDHTEDVLERAEFMESQWKQIGVMTSASIQPVPQLIFECGKCPQFADCTGKNIKNPIFDLPRLSESKFDKLTKAGILRIEEIPDEFPLTDNQNIVREAVKADKPFVGATLPVALSRISWPACYLDFETVISAIPLYPDIAPHTQIPTQYSAHHCSEIGKVVGHCEFLADPKKDCRLDLALRLIDDLKGQGTIIVYSNFEKTIMNGLASDFPHLATELISLIGRMVDLQVVIKENIYWADFHGSYSIKCVLPVVVPDMSYDHLPIADGDSAIASFAYMALGHYDDEHTNNVRSELLEYCKLDTLAMVKLHVSLAEVVQGSCPASTASSAIRL